jgi:hypothetical protein
MCMSIIALLAFIICLDEMRKYNETLRLVYAPMAERNQPILQSMDSRGYARRYSID